MAEDLGYAGRETDAAGMARVIWTREALADLAAIRAYIAQFDPDAAARFAARLIEAGEGLADFPRKGPEIDDGLRRWSLVRPYAIRYLIDSDAVYILDIVHRARADRA